MRRAYASSMSAEQERSADARTDVTNERTNADPRSPSEDTSPLVTRGRAYGDFPVAPFTAALEEVAGGLRIARQRDEVIRRGNRNEISWVVRRLVHMRDGYSCRWCGSCDDLVLDHITPWSAGGADVSENLRTLCSSCNGSRSNRLTDNYARVLPVTARCGECWGDRKPETHTPAFCGKCRMTSWVAFEEELL